jgi:hypothetical protein
MNFVLLVPAENIMYQSDVVLRPSMSKVEWRLPLVNDVSGIPMSIEPQHSREFHSSNKYMYYWSMLENYVFLI